MQMFLHETAWGDELSSLFMDSVCKLILTSVNGRTQAGYLKEGLNSRIGAPLLKILV